MAPGVSPEAPRVCHIKKLLAFYTSRSPFHNFKKICPSLFSVLWPVVICNIIYILYSSTTTRSTARWRVRCRSWRRACRRCSSATTTPPSETLRTSSPIWKWISTGWSREGETNVLKITGQVYAAILYFRVVSSQPGNLKFYLYLRLLCCQAGLSNNPSFQ